MARSLVLVTGGSSGIGRALVETVPWRDARIVDLSRRGSPGVEHRAADLADPAGWEVASQLFARELDGFDGERVVFFHSAGTLQPMGFAGEVDPRSYARNVLLNSAAPQILGDAFLRAARGTRAGCQLVMISSGAAHGVYPGWSSYGAGKAAVDQWVRTAGAEQELRGASCRVLAIAPGVVATPMQEEIRATAERDFPEVGRFVGLHRDGELRDAKRVAHEIWALLDRDLPNGAVVDLRELAEVEETVR
jgi:benzil reductase ((S)-benzoin forming)